jgi:hypothetical protein
METFLLIWIMGAVIAFVMWGLAYLVSNENNIWGSYIHKLHKKENRTTLIVLAFIPFVNLFVGIGFYGVFLQWVLTLYILPLKGLIWLINKMRGVHEK